MGRGYLRSRPKQQQQNSSVSVKTQQCWMCENTVRRSWEHRVDMAMVHFFLCVWCLTLGKASSRQDSDSAEMGPSPWFSVPVWFWARAHGSLSPVWVDRPDNTKVENILPGISVGHCLTPVLRVTSSIWTQCSVRVTSTFLSVSENWFSPGFLKTLQYEPR